MTTIRKTVDGATAAHAAWEAVRDFPTPHRRLAPGFLTAVAAAGTERTITFSNGLVATESLVSLDEEAMRLANAIVGGRPRHYNGAIRVIADGPCRCRLEWTVDVLPGDIAAGVAAMMEHGCADMKRTLEASAARESGAGAPAANAAG